MVYPLEGTSAIRQVSNQYILWYLPSPLVANKNFSHVHPPHEIPPLYPKHFLPCKMKGVAPSNPFEIYRSSNLNLEDLFLCSSMNYW